MCARSALLEEGAHLPYTFAYDRADGAIIVQRGSVARTNAADVDSLRMRAHGDVLANSPAVPYLEWNVTVTSMRFINAGNYHNGRLRCYCILITQQYAAGSRIC
ncbi:unnamed protein product [Onchocerca ochengi]|uniref:Uncharacterized protein n=1 Tax=Onchocerca ochengi TaxID=42157 RepID=A0A182EIH1_ONCOC|nr:unnamed protein product [Onchocerca ochengi]